MTLLTNGNYDQVFEMSEWLLTQTARATMAFPSVPMPVSTADFDADVTTDARIERIWFRDRPAVWASRSKLGPLHRNTGDMVTLAITLGVHINLNKILMDIGGQATMQDLANDPTYAPIRKIDFTSFVEIHDHIEVQNLDVRPDREEPGTVRVPCLVIDFNPSLGIPSNWPRVDVQINEQELRNAAAIMLMMAAATIRTPGDPNAAEGVFRGAVNMLKVEIQDVIAQRLAALSTWKTADTGKVILYADTSAQPMPIRRLDAKTFDESLAIGVSRLGNFGNTASFGFSTRRGRGATLDELGITVSNRMLLRGTIRPALIDLFELDRSDFAPGEYCVLRHAVSDAKLGEGRGKINALMAFVDGSEQVRILLDFSQDVMAGVTCHAVLDLHLGFSVARALSGASQVLRITPSLLNPESAVVSKRVDVAWWVYVGAAVIGGAVAVAITAVLDAVVFELTAATRLYETVTGMGLGESDNPLSLPITLTSPWVELNDPGAPSMPTAMGQVLATSFGAAAHDLYIGARFSVLPDPLLVTFQIPDSDDARRRLDGIGGPLSETTEWALPIDDAIDLVDAGHTLLVPIPPDAPVRVVKVIPAGGIPYLKTERDDLGINNLGNLPKRIPAIPSHL